MEKREEKNYNARHRRIMFKILNLNPTIQADNKKKKTTTRTKCCSPEATSTFRRFSL